MPSTDVLPADRRALLEPQANRAEEQAMITRADVGKLLNTNAAGAAVLSVYLRVPVNPAALRGLPAKVGELIASAAADHPAAPGAVQVPATDRDAVRGLVSEHARDWLDHTAAIFVCGELSLAEVIVLPGAIPERAVIAGRPHVRPLLVALQRYPAYHVAVVDRRHAWVLNVHGDRIETLARADADGVRSPGFGGWYGLESYKINERVIQLARHHYRDVAAMLQHAARTTGPQPLVLGGHEASTPQFLALLPAELRERFAGSFVADPHTLTPARVRKLADPVIERWVAAREHRLAAEVGEQAWGEWGAAGPGECAAAVNQHAVQLLVVPDDGLIPGFACPRCDLLAAEHGDCPACGTALRPVPDLAEEMVVTTLGDGGLVEAVQDPPHGVAARLRFPAPR